MTKTALLIDITSIQKYVFLSNKLKENLGASFLISDLYNSMVSKNDAVKDIPLKINGEYDGYMGGGNALLFFNSKVDAEEFVIEWTKSLLVLAPGVTVATAINEWNEGEDKFTNSRDALFDKLRENKSRFISQTIIPRHGISAECKSDGYSMDVWSNSEGDYISASTNAKICAFPASKKKTDEDFNEPLGTNFYFTDLLEDLGQSKGSENHIAIVHIDGNSMGDRFKKLNSLEATKQLSKDVEKAVKESFKILLKAIVFELQDEKKKGYLSIKKEGELPIRPIIMGGDDITFACDGRMGIYYAKIFMEAFQNQEDNNGNNLKLSSCAGIAVIKTKYPFYKGYQLAEELCANAKSKRREMGNNGSWLDFHIAYGGFSGSLKEIRDIHYNAALGSLIYRPYKILDSSENSFETFISNAKELSKKWPNNKLKELREVLTLGNDAAKIFVSEMEARGLELPDIDTKGYNKILFKNRLTLYFDMLELLEYYPKYELEDAN